MVADEMPSSEYPHFEQLELAGQQKLSPERGLGFVHSSRQTGLHISRKQTALFILPKW